VDFAHVEKGGADLLAFNFLDALALEAENLFVIGNDVLQGFNGDAQVINLL
jgi:hypothetical protein